MLLRKVLKQWFRRNIIYSETFLLLMVFYHCSLIRHSEMLLHPTPHAHLGPALYRLCLNCHRGGSRCEDMLFGHSFPPHALDHRVSVRCLYEWRGRNRVGSYQVDERLYVTSRCTLRYYCACGACSSLWLHLTM